jgi:hypothetical protein
MSDEAEQRGPNYKTKVDYDGLFRAIGNREASTPDMLQWVFNHAGVHPNLIPLDDWPCFGAVRMLAHAHIDYPGFLQVWQKLIPNQTQLKLQERTKDDGRATPLLDMLEKEIAELPNRSEKESGISTGTAEAGAGKSNGA